MRHSRAKPGTFARERAEVAIAALSKASREPRRWIWSSSTVTWIDEQPNVGLAESRIICPQPFVEHVAEAANHIGRNAALTGSQAHKGAQAALMLYALRTNHSAS